MLSQKKVLIAESDDVIRALLSLILERQGFSVDAVAGTARLLERVRKIAYDAIIVALSANNGATVLHRLAEQIPKIVPRVIVTTDAIAAAAPLATVPVFSIVKKPVEIGDFVELVRKCANLVEPAQSA